MEVINDKDLERKYKFDVEKIKQQLLAIKENGKEMYFGNVLFYTKVAGLKMFDKLQDAEVNCVIEKTKLKGMIKIRFTDLPDKFAK